MGGLGDLATTTEGDPIDGHDHRLGKGFEARRHRLAAPHKVPHRYVPALPHAPGKFRDVTTSGEGTVPCAGQNYCVHVGCFDRVEQCHQSIDHFIAQRIQLVRTVEREKRDLVLDVHEYGIAHFSFSSACCGLRHHSGSRVYVYSLGSILASCLDPQTAPGNASSRRRASCSTAKVFEDRKSTRLNSSH